MKGTWQTTDSGAGAVAGIAAAAVIGILAWQAAGSAAAALGDALAIGTVAAGSFGAGAGLALLAVRLRHRHAAAPAAVPRLWQPNPHAVPAPPRTAAPAPVINISLDAGLIASLARDVPAVTAPGLTPDAAAGILDAALRARLAQHAPAAIPPARNK